MKPILRQKIKINLRHASCHSLHLTQKTAIKRRLIDVFETLIDRFHETFVFINLFRFYFNMHSNIYSCLSHPLNIKEENIIDSHAA